MTKIFCSRVWEKQPLKKRRTNYEIEQSDKGLKCPHCKETLSRKQTLQAHIERFHGQLASTIPEVPKKGKGKGKKSSVPSTLHPDIKSCNRNQQVNQPFKFSHLQVYFRSKNILLTNCIIAYNSCYCFQTKHSLSTKQKYLMIFQKSPHFATIYFIVCKKY